MTAPDKIYVHTGAHLGLLTLTTIPVGGPEEQEFIRKEALREWLIEQRDCSFYTDQDAYEAFQEIIDKLNSM